MASYDLVGPAPLVLRITGEMNIYRADELKQVLVDALTNNAAVDVDLSQVSEIDTVGVQLIVAARKQAVRSERNLQIVAQSQAVAEAMELLDVAMCLGIGGAACLRCDRQAKCFAS